MTRRPSILPGFFPRIRRNWRQRALNRPSDTPFAHLMVSLFILIVMLVSVGACVLFFVLLFRYW